MSKKHLKNILNRKAIKPLNNAVGGLGLPSKMPGFAYGISARNCKLGSILAKQEGTVCSGCYALRNNYTYPSVQKSHERREKALEDLHEWAAGMVNLLWAITDDTPPEQRYFRFHDSGDLQSVKHLQAIVRVAEFNPRWQFWLPTREYGMIKAYRKAGGTFPSNLTVRLSAIRINESAPKLSVGLACPTSTVSAGEGYACPAREQKNACGDCRACWDMEVKNVDYKKH
jgi:hypothetical protein